MVTCHYQARQAKFIETVPAYLIEEVLASVRINIGLCPLSRAITVFNVI